jgi:hypothetical protein
MNPGIGRQTENSMNILNRLLLFAKKSTPFLYLLFIFVYMTPHIAALTDAQKSTLQSGVYYFNTEDDTSCGTDTTGASGSTAGSGSGSWNSSLQPPYILEQFVIETLKDVAAKRGVPSTGIVTQDHVTALLAFAWGEGGDINNTGLFNPFNTGLSDPALVDGNASLDGRQAFKSFDAGVEATARTMVGSFQNRLADVLIQPSSTTEDVMHALAYWYNYPGNHPWAEASRGNEDNYFKVRMQLVQQVTSGYERMAGVVIGTPEKEAITNKINPGLLQFMGGGSSSLSSGSSGSACASTNGGVVAGSIAQTAINFSWPESHKLQPKPEYSAALAQYNPSAPYGGADCGAFVGTVMRASGADPNYPLAVTTTQEAYVRAHPEKYDVIDSVSSTADLLPGDILIVGSASGPKGHTYIFVGPQPNGTDEASASGGDRMPNLGKADVVDSLGRGNYMRARLK